MILKIDSKFKTRFPDLTVLTLHIRDVKIQKRGAELEKFKVEVIKQVRNDYSLD
jgi:DNA/RNA-binding domain of Phe-tRNA-synthetase-like protein